VVPHKTSAVAFSCHSIKLSGNHFVVCVTVFVCMLLYVFLFSTINKFSFFSFSRDINRMMMMMNLVDSGVHWLLDMIVKTDQYNQV
jgi:hypothetical protein